MLVEDSEKTPKHDMSPQSVVLQPEIGRVRLRRATEAAPCAIDILARGVAVAGRGDVGTSERGDILLARAFAFAGVTICILMKWGCDFSHARASDFVSKYRSTTMASFSARLRPERRAAFRLTTAGPVSTATSSSLPKIILLP